MAGDVVIDMPPPAGAAPALPAAPDMVTALPEPAPAAASEAIREPAPEPAPPPRIFTPEPKRGYAAPPMPRGLHSPLAVIEAQDYETPLHKYLGFKI
ncbi:MAG: hypothetical protein ACXW25_09015, partial [Rhodospirillales bacterium]